ncbi:nuclear transport factor 2 family protein [Rhodococcus sp. ACT016]|uniref:nuclear transport factor 2 family protein n=1 Tax=Rhodococcus sp. ACT016 TaxID=3134808 RepID=UPI003D287FA6
MTNQPLHAPPAAPSGSLEDRLAAVEDTLAILQLEGAYAPAWDSGDAEAWADLFTEDGIFELAEVGAVPGTTILGRDALRQFCVEFTARTPGIHLLNTPSIVLDGDEATARIHFEFRSGGTGDGETRQAHVAGHYTVRYRRTLDGWRIAHRHEVAVGRTRSWFYSY